MESRPAHVIALSEPAANVARKVRQVLADEGQTVRLHLPSRFARREEGESPINGDFKTLMAESFGNASCMVFVTAAGIAVRAIAGEIKDKKTDPAVLVIDNQGQFVISLLSGHLGKANEIARRLAAALGATPVITTASDSLKIPALDELAVSRGWRVENWDEVKQVMAAMVNGDKVLAMVDRLHYLEQLEFPSNVKVVPVSESTDTASFAAAFVISTRANLPRFSNPVLVIRPRTVIVGVGCRRGISKDNIVFAIRESLKAADRSFSAVKCLATIELKRYETNLVEAAADLGLPLEFVTAEDIARVENRFSCSGFVKSKVGVGAVCEPVAYLSGREPELVLGKTVYGGVTVAVFEETPNDANNRNSEEGQMS